MDKSLKYNNFLFHACLGLLLISPAYAEMPIYQLAIKNHQFIPPILEIPAATKVKLLVENQDATPEEFESHELNREKIITGHSRAIIYIGPLEPGQYPFFGEFNPDTAKGTIIAK